MRRVYTRLIREFKPERLPEQFRRIREAYETLHRYAAWNDANDDSDNDENKSELRDQPETESAPMPRRMEPAECWRWALAGETRRAYDALRELQLAQPDQPDLLLRLYWLLFVNPELDSARVPRDWLVEGLRMCAQYHRLFEQYSNEIAGDPNEVMHDRFVNLSNSCGDPCSLSCSNAAGQRFQGLNSGLWFTTTWTRIGIRCHGRVGLKALFALAMARA